MSNPRRDPARAGSNPSGVHFLSAAHIAGQLVRASGVGSNDLVVEFGAGHGALTVPLAGTGATVLAVERDEHFVRSLRRRLQRHDSVRVIHSDVRGFVLPRRPFSVVANIPFALSSQLLRRLLNPEPNPLRGGELLVEWGLAKRLTARVPRDVELAWWNARFSLELRRKVPARSFAPAPNVHAAHLGMRRSAHLTRPQQKALWALLTAAYQRPAQPASALLAPVAGGRRAARLLTQHGSAARAPAGELTPAQWAALARELAVLGHWPELPRRLRSG